MATKKRSAPRLIKRYAGNRLYDPETGTYLTLNDLRRLELEGCEIAVRDTATGQDVTNEVISAGASH